MSDSTSSHIINADKGLNAVQRIIWILVNFLRNHFRRNDCGKLAIKAFKPELDEIDFQSISKLSSPSRFMSDLFWRKIDWRQVKDELGSIHVLDTGSGDGAYALKLRSYGCEFEHYRGLDMTEYSQWSEITREQSNITFERQDSADLLKHIPRDTNLFISQSAIEHFEQDLKYFKDIKRFIESTSKPTIQIHLFPSAECLKLYLWHGVRQYTPRTVSKITSMFEGGNAYSVLYKLGGQRCNQLHWKYVTVPTYLRGYDKRESSTDEYFKKLQSAILHDTQEPSKDASFYALVIHSNCQSPVFENMKSLG